MRRTIPVGRVQVQVYEWRHPSGRQYWRWDFVDPDTGRRRQLTASTIDRLAERIASQLRGRQPTDDLPAMIRERLARILAVDPTLAGYATFIAEAGAGARRTLREVAQEFLAAKEAARGLSERNIRSLRGDVANLLVHVDPEKPIRAVTVADLERWIEDHHHLSAKRRRNLRASAVTLFRWARRRKYLPHELTAAETIEAPAVPRRIPDTYSPDQIAAILHACPVPYRPWIVLSGFHGIRYSEMFPPYGSGKSPLDWSDIDFTRGLIVVRPETAKTGERRVIPVHQHAARWLVAAPSGRVVPARPPNKRLKREDAITTVLGRLVGGWKANGLRHSFISYRAALVGIAQTALEAGNSESEARRSYHDAKSREDAEAWFAVLAGENTVQQFRRRA